ncbi:MAG: restriction endonuclease subunit S [Deltaproteobacteria bacterium]|nr:restriction endonuclease subunit S [Deltaproteobacteria bacterium]
MSTTMHELGSVAEVFNGKTPSKTEQRDSGHPVLKIKDVTENGNFKKRFESFVEAKLISKLKKKLVAAGDILILNAAHNADYVGSKVYRAEESVVGSLATGEWLIVRPDATLLNPDFAYFWIIDGKTKKDIRELVKGIHLYPKDVEGLRIPLPPLPEQRRIADILDKADAIRRKRQEAVRLTDELLCSAFLEKFGDPVTNPKGWETKSLGALSLRFSDGPFGSNLKSSHYVDSGVRVIRLQNIGIGEFIDKDKAYISEKHFISLRKHECLPGDVLIGTMGDPNLRACILPETINMALNKADCVQMRVDPSICTPEYISFMLNQPGTLALAAHMLHGQTRVRISMGTLRELAVPVPPLKLQNEFSGIVSRMQKIISKQKRFEELSDKKFNSLIQRAFRGELTNLDESIEPVIPLPRPFHAQRTYSGKVVPLKRAKKEREESAPAEAKRHAGHDMYNKAALAAYIVHKCHDPAEPMGRVKLAKLFYLVQRKVDLTLTETFTRRAAGPLDDAIFKFLNIAVKRSWLRLLPQEGKKKPVAPDNSCETAVQQAVKYLGERRQAVDEVLSSLKAMQWYDLECWATVDAVAEELAASGKSLTVRNILQALAASPEWRQKLEKPAFSELGITSALLGLRKLEFIKN